MPTYRKQVVLLLVAAMLMTVGCSAQPAPAAPAQTAAEQKPVEPVTPEVPPVDDAQSEAVTAWLKERAHPLTGVTAGAPTDDLQPLRQILAGVEVVGLGEQTHGTREFFQMKHRLLEFLVKEMGYTVFAMEAGYAPGLAVNEYVLTGKGTPEEVVRGLGFPVWNTREVVDLVRWMRTFNETVPPEKQVRFVGFDVQVLGAGAVFLEKYGKQHFPDEWGPFERVVREAGTKAQGRRDAATAQANLKQLQELEGLLTARRAEFASRSSPAEAQQAINLARNMARYYEAHQVVPEEQSVPVRDRYMAKTILELRAELGAGTKMVVWAHNSHVMHHWEWMGTRLQEELGDRYYALGFLFREGAFQAWNDRRVMTEWTVGPAKEGWHEWYFASAGVGLSLVDLRQGDRPEAVRQWLNDARPQRAMGAYYDPATDGYSGKIPLAVYDGLIYVPVTTRAQPQ